jgi:mannose-6-phosphate isomerase-like protein (cupin superfamily)
VITVLESRRAARAGVVDYLQPAEVAELTRFYADEVASGRFPWIEFDADERWHQRLYRDRRVDIWVISWLPEQGTRLHDHGGSSGAFTVLSGALTESVPSGYQDARMRVRDTDVRAGSSVRFGRHYIHDVRNLANRPAISVHAYSPPLTSMTYYDVAAGELVTAETVATDRPEAAAGSAHRIAS